MKPATHQGTCQCCGSVQMLPAGVLAKHGYTVQWGFFSGTCHGSGHAPYEQSCALIERFVARAEARLAELVAFKAALLAPPAALDRAWVHVYRRSYAARGLNGHSWMEVPLSFIRHASTCGGSDWLEVRYQHPDDKPENGPRRLDLYGVHAAEPVVYVAHLNAKRAAALDGELRQIREYITWQRRRVAEWSEKPLLPRGGRPVAVAGA